MSTIHLFDDSNNASDNRLGDLEKTIIINNLMEVPFGERDEEWRDTFLTNIAASTLKLAETEVVIGPDGFPYFQLESAPKDQNFQAFVIKNRLKDFVLPKGFGIAINTQYENPDWVFTYGDLVNYFLNDEFYTDNSIFSRKNEQTVIGKDEEILVGQPSEVILPQVARAQLREFLDYYGVKNPKVMLIARNYKDEKKVSQDLVFNIVANQFRTEKEFTDIMEAIGWFLPRHYSYIGLDEFAVENGFLPL
ncbi:hypothetical protein ACR78Z_21340 [Sphingobacterium thalpophilum]|uniref:Uncharacterized protein n=1 Tax=Sphingobacterium thalpophilum TaxID=259 RepID=A0A4U9UK76_9SPHI|nr:hypothetical protein [Sphingobacterium thalpophilum]VTR30034.1 Uncharacterised protein [Sphingobacterium thalpophilum]